MAGLVQTPAGRRIGAITVLRDDRPLAALLEGDPLRTLIDLPLSELRGLRPSLARPRPGLRELIEALITYQTAREASVPTH